MEGIQFVTNDGCSTPNKKLETVDMTFWMAGSNSKRGTDC
jgi:hypothetical protein